MAVPRLDELPKQATIRRQLGTLCTGGVEPYWVIDNCRFLLGLACYRDHLDAEADPSEEALVVALVRYLREAVEQVDRRQHQILLRIVMALDEDSPYLGTTATHRRAEAGKLFRNGRKIVSWGTIRQHHEPRALDDLATIMYADEQKARKILV